MNPLRISCYNSLVTHLEVQTWIDNYVDAWRSPGTTKLADLFAGNSSYRVSPWKQPLRGLQELEVFWVQARSGPDEAFKLQSKIIAVENRTAVVRVDVSYEEDEPGQWRDLWIILFDDNGRCVSFEEWPFSSEQEDGQKF